MSKKVVPIPVRAISINDARLCLNCDNIIQSRVCPICSSTQQLFLVQFLGSLKREELKRFVVNGEGEVETIDIQPNGKTNHHLKTCSH